MDKDDLGCNEFSRAPGTTTKSTSASGSPNLNPILVQSDRYGYVKTFSVGPLSVTWEGVAALVQ